MGDTTEVLDLDWLQRSTLATLSIAQTAKLLGLNQRSVSGAVARGELPSLRIGRRILIPRLALLRLLGADPDTPNVNTPSGVSDG